MRICKIMYDFTVTKSMDYLNNVAEWYMAVLLDYCWLIYLSIRLISLLDFSHLCGTSMGL